MSDTRERLARALRQLNDDLNKMNEFYAADALLDAMREVAREAEDRCKKYTAMVDAAHATAIAALEQRVAALEQHLRLLRQGPIYGTVDDVIDLRQRVAALEQAGESRTHAATDSRPDSPSAPAPDGPWSSKTVSGSGLLFCPECNCYHLPGGFCTERLRRGEADAEAGRTRPMADVMAELREKYKAPAPEPLWPTKENPVVSYITTDPASSPAPEPECNCGGGPFHGPGCPTNPVTATRAQLEREAGERMVRRFAAWLKERWPIFLDGTDMAAVAERFLKEGA